MNKKMVICDIDNTLVVKHMNLTPRAKRVIETLRKHGVYFGIASGRSMVEVRRMVENWGFTDLDILIGLNGSVLWDGITRQESQYFLMRRATIQKVIEIMHQFPTTNTLMYRGNQLMCTAVDELVSLSVASSRMEAMQVQEETEFYQEDRAKIMFRVREEDMPRIEEYFKQHPSTEYRAFKTQASLLEFSDVHVSKAYTMKQFCAFHDIDVKDVIAFGDTSNDNDLLEASGWGVCMANGSEDTKAIADEITRKPCDEDGWADYMEQHFIRPNEWL